METIKEEKKADLEQLLNSLIEKGWKPFGRNYDQMIKSADRCFRACVKNTEEGEKPRVWIRSYLIRELVSKESGLWQFVCKNGMIKNPNIDRYWKNYFELDHIEYYQSDFQYWVLESSLKDESELEDFLLSNIKVGNED